MSSLIVEVSEISHVEPHPHADRMEIAHVKGWTCCIRKGQFQPGDKAVYLPPETIIPHTLSDRLGITKYLVPLPKDAEGVRPDASRIKVARLRGFASYGLLLELDDPEWEVGQDVAEHYGAFKWDPPEPSSDGDEETPHSAFHRYYDMENIRNFPDLFQQDEAVFVTEKLHGRNARLALIKEDNEAGELVWKWAAGSHDVRRKEKSIRTRRFNAVDLVESLILDSTEVDIDQIIDTKDGQFWKVNELIPKNEEDEGDNRILFRATQINEAGEPLLITSEFWRCFTPEIKAMLTELSGCDYDDPEGKPAHEGGHNVILFGEQFGSGVQSGYAYGYTNGHKGFRAFDVTVDGQYLSFTQKLKLFQKFNVPAVPVLWQGPYNLQKIEELAEGPSTVSEGANIQDDSVKIGREGVVVTSAAEGVGNTPRKFHARRQLKCINFSYLERKDGTEYH